MDRQAKIEETFLAPIGSALLSKDTQVITSPGFAAADSGFDGAVQVVERDGWYQTITPSTGTTQGNEIVYSQLADADVEAVVDATIAQYRAAGVPFKWCVGPLTTPAGFGDVLASRGFTSWAVRGMAIEVDRFLQTSKSSALENARARESAASATVELVTSATLPAYYEAWSRGWDTQSPNVDAWCADHVRAMSTGRFHFYLSRVDGEVAGTAGFIVKPNCAYLVGGNVLAQCRGRGLYRALLAERLAAIAARGLRLAVTQAREATSAPILEYLGFESLYQSFIYRWEP